MGVKIRDIPGVLISETKNCNPKKVMPKFNRGFNEALTQQGNVEIGNNPKKLRQVISDVPIPYADTQTGRISLCMYIDAIRDAIITNQKDLFIVMKESE